MSKHTPGPWEYVHGKSEKWDGSRVVIEGMGFSAPYYLEHGSGRCHRTDADNRLISVAPKMLAALKDAFEQLTGGDTLQSQSHPDSPYHYLYSVITEAEGGAA
jgi:hypothetical protein